MARAGLSRQAVVDLALAVVDDAGSRGFEDLTLSAVAARAGVAVPSLYKHIGGLPELRRAVARSCVSELAEVIETAVASAVPEAQPGAAELRAAANAVRFFARRTPGRYDASQGSSWAQDPDAVEVQQAGARSVTAIAEILAQFDVAPDHLIDAVRAVRAALHGFVVLELDGGFGMPEDVDASFQFLVDALVRSLALPSLPESRTVRSGPATPSGGRAASAADARAGDPDRPRAR
ncbi:MAG: WHG domain-containing protein [Cellulomonas sp.]